MDWFIDWLQFGYIQITMVKSFKFNNMYLFEKKTIILLLIFSLKY